MDQHHNQIHRVDLDIKVVRLDIRHKGIPDTLVIILKVIFLL
jgi:hypothetical protein